MLFFQRQFLDLIRIGTKTQTIRLWRYPRVKIGQPGAMQRRKATPPVFVRPAL